MEEKHGEHQGPAKSLHSGALEGLLQLSSLLGSTSTRKRKDNSQEPADEAYLKSLQEQGLTERGLKRFKTPENYASQERRCRPSTDYLKYFKTTDPSLAQKSIDFRMPSVEQAARAEDLVMLWAFYNGKEELRRAEFRFKPELYLDNVQLKTALQHIQSFAGLKEFIKSWCSTARPAPSKPQEVVTLYSSKSGVGNVHYSTKTGVTFPDNGQPRSLADHVYPELKRQKLSPIDEETHKLADFERGISDLTRYIEHTGTLPGVEDLPWLEQLKQRAGAGFHANELAGLNEAVGVGLQHHALQHPVHSSVLPLMRANITTGLEALLGVSLSQTTTGAVPGAATCTEAAQPPPVAVPQAGEIINDTPDAPAPSPAPVAPAPSDSDVPVSSADEDEVTLMPEDTNEAQNKAKDTENTEKSIVPSLAATPSKSAAIALRASTQGLPFDVMTALRGAEEGRVMTSNEVLTLIGACIANKVPLSPCPPIEPKVGEVYIMDRNRSKIKQDGYQWLKEHHSTLMVGGERRLKCYFTTSRIGDLKRRVFWDLMKAEAAPDLAVVQYLPCTTQPKSVMSDATGLNLTSSPSKMTNPSVMMGKYAPGMTNPSTSLSSMAAHQAAMVAGAAVHQAAMMAGAKAAAAGQQYGGYTLQGTSSQNPSTSHMQPAVYMPPGLMAWLPSRLGSKKDESEVEQMEGGLQAHNILRSVKFQPKDEAGSMSPASQFNSQGQASLFGSAPPSASFNLGPGALPSPVNAKVIPPGGKAPKDDPLASKQGDDLTASTLNPIPAPVLAKFIAADRTSGVKMGDTLLELVDTGLFEDGALFDVAMSLMNIEVPVDECAVMFDRFAKYVTSGNVAMVNRYAQALAKQLKG